MLPSVIMRRFTFTFMFVLFLTILLPLNILPSTAFAQTKAVQCSQGKLCSFTLPSHTAIAQTGAALTVQKVWTRDGNGNDKASFNPGDAIQYALYVNNSSSSTITASFHFEDYWGTINDGVLQIMDHIFQNVSVPAGVTTGYYTPTTVPKNALPGSFTDRVIVSWDQNNQLNQARGYGSFTVTGSVQVKRNGNPVPYYSQFQGQPTQGRDCGPTSVLMVLTYYGKGPGLSENGITQVRKHTYHPTGGNTFNTDLEKALSDYGSPWTEIPRTIPNLPNPDAQLTDMAAAIMQGQPVIAFLNGSDLPNHPTNYGGHWLVLRGFSSDGTTNYVLVNDPDSDYSGGYPGHPSKLKMSDFRTAEVNGESDQPYGIVVTS